jgi:hypothetical protein
MMIQISKLLNNPQSSKVLSFLIGMGVVVLLFHKPLSFEKTLALSVEDIEGRVVPNGGKCYSYVAEDCPCEKSVAK